MTETGLLATSLGKLLATPVHTNGYGSAYLIFPYTGHSLQRLLNSLLFSDRVSYIARAGFQLEAIPLSLPELLQGLAHLSAYFSA